MTGDRVGLSASGFTATADGLKAFEGPGVVPVTKQLLQLGCSAHALHVMHLEKEQKEKGCLEAAKSTERGSTTKETRNKSLL